MNIHFTKYAEKKFDILNKHKVFFRKEQIENAINLPERKSKKGKYFDAEKEGVKVIYTKEEDIIKIITFFPTKKIKNGI